MRHALRSRSNGFKVHSILGPQPQLPQPSRYHYDAARMAEFSLPTKKWARAHWNMRPVWKRLIINSLPAKRKASVTGQRSNLKKLVVAACGVSPSGLEGESGTIPP
jgi:hypothetical protein